MSSNREQRGFGFFVAPCVDRHQRMLAAQRLVKRVEVSCDLVFGVGFGKAAVHRQREGVRVMCVARARRERDAFAVKRRGAAPFEVVAESDGRQRRIGFAQLRVQLQPPQRRRPRGIDVRQRRHGRHPNQAKIRMRKARPCFGKLRIDLRRPGKELDRLAISECPLLP